MGESSDEQIFSQRRSIKQKDLSELFDSEEYYATNYDNDYMNNILLEVFGTGKEYNYIYDEPIEEKEVIKHKDKIESIDKLDVEQCAEWIANNLNIQYDDVLPVVRNIDQGLSPYYIALHIKDCNLTLDNILHIKNNIIDFRKYKNIKDQIVQYNSNINLQLNTLEYIIQYKKYIDKINKDNIHEIENIIEEIITIIDNNYNINNYNNINTTLSNNILNINNNNNIIKYLMVYPPFIKFIIKLFSTKGTIKINNIIYNIEDNKIKDNIKEIEDIDNIEEIYIEDRIIEDNIIYYIKDIIEDKNTLINRINKIVRNYYINDIKDKMNNKRDKEIYNNIIKYIIKNNYIYNSYCVGIAEYRNCVKITIINYNLEEIEKINIKKKDIIETMADIKDRYKNITIGITGTTSNIRFMKKLLEDNDYTLTYIEYAEVDDLSYHCAIRMCAPELLVYYALIGNINIYYSNYYMVDNNYSTIIKNNIIKEGLLTALSIIGIDINRAIISKEYRNLLKLIMDDNMISKIIDYGYIERLSDIENIIDDRRVVNILGYLRIYNYDRKIRNTEILDSTLLHPNDYDVVRMICAAAVGEDEIDENNPSKRVSEIMDGDLTEVLQMIENDNNLMRCIHYTKYNRDINEIGEERMAESMIGSVKNKIFKGTVIKKSEEYIRVSVEGIGCREGITLKEKNYERNIEKIDNFIVSVRSNKHNINEEVNIKITGQNGFFITGEIIKNKGMERRYKYTESVLYRKDNINNLLTEDNPVVIRDSRMDRSAVIMLLLDNIIINIKLIEDKEIKIENKLYNNIKEVENYIKNIFIMYDRVKNNNKYVKNEREAVESINRNYKNRDNIIYRYYLSRSYPGYITFYYRNKNRDYKEYIKLRDKLKYKEKEFNSLDDFIVYRKAL